MDVAASKSGGTKSRKVSSDNAEVLVAIGVAHESYDSLETLIANLPPRTGAAYIVVFSQADGLVPDEVAQALARRAGRPAVVASSRGRPQAEHIYVAPAGHSLVVEGDDL